MASTPTSATAAPAVHTRRITYVDPVHVELAWDEADDVLTIELAGELCTWSSEVLRAALLELIAASGCRRVEIDASDVTFLDARGLRLLLTARTRAAERGTSLAMTVPSAAVTRVLNLCGLDHAFDPSIVPAR